MTTTTRNPLADTIASNIKAELDRLGWGYDDLARAVDLPIERVSEWQAAATSMELNELAAVAQALGLTASSLTIGPGIDPRAQCPCPSWCGHKAGHEYETISLAGEPARDHTRHVSDLGGHSVSVTAGALLTEAGEKVERPVVDLWLFGNGVEYPRHKRGMSATEARSLARFLYDGLNAAADLLDEIESD